MIVRRRAHIRNGRVVKTRAYNRKEIRTVYDRGRPGKLVVDTDFGTRARMGRNHLLAGRKSTSGYGDGVAVIRDPRTGRIFGRPPRFKMTKGRYAVPSNARTARGNLRVKEITEKK